jgi:hypothetical protein
MPDHENLDRETLLQRILECRKAEAMIDAVDMEVWRLASGATIDAWRLPEFASGIVAEAAARMRSAVGAMQVRAASETV